MRSFLCTLLLVGLSFTNEEVLDKKALDTKAPGFYSRTLEGQSFYLSDELSKDRSIFLSFFATWCAPCRQEIPVIDSLKNIYPDTDFYLVNVNEKYKKVKKFTESMNISMPILMDKYGQVAEKYEALVLPRSVIIDANGNIVYNHTGYAPGDEKEFIEVLNTLRKNED